MQHLLKMLATYELLWLKSLHEEQIIMCFLFKGSHCLSVDKSVQK